MQKHTKLVAKLSVVVVAMFGFGFLLVPLYNVVCQQFGINGKVSLTATKQAQRTNQQRMITVEFVAQTNANLAWDFFPNTYRIKIHPGENKRVAYHAKNQSAHAMTVQAIPSVAPGVASKYLRKTECFCFQQQHLAAGAEMDMPILFHIDPELPESIHTITLSYTLFSAKDKHEPSAKPKGRISS
jgi:cytochrome c oxidase assembly protein subunit 11